MIGKLSLTGLFAVLTLTLIGCSSVPMPKGTSKGYTSARFVAPNEPLGNETLPEVIEGNRMIQQAITQQLEAGGIKMTEGPSDLIIAYLIIFQDNVSTTYSNQHYGYQDFTEIVDQAHLKGTATQYPVKVQKRAIVIDIIDAKTFKLVYRDYGLSGSLLNVPEEEHQAHIDLVVANALAKFLK